MAMKIESFNRWAVTGTPVGKNGLDDLYGLFLFLGAFPWANKFYWRRLLELPGSYLCLFELFFFFFNFEFQMNKIK